MILAAVKRYSPLEQHVLARRRKVVQLASRLGSRTTHRSTVRPRTLRESFRRAASSPRLILSQLISWTALGDCAFPWVQPQDVWNGSPVDRPALPGRTLPAAQRAPLHLALLYRQLPSSQSRSLVGRLALPGRTLPDSQRAYLG